MTQFNLEDRVGQVAYRSRVDWRAAKRPSGGLRRRRAVAGARAHAARDSLHSSPRPPLSPLTTPTHRCRALLSSPNFKIRMIHVAAAKIFINTIHVGTSTTCLPVLNLDFFTLSTFESAINHCKDAYYDRR